MTTFKKLFNTLIFSCLFFVASAFLATGAHAAPRLYFDPSSYTSVRDSDFQIKVQIDAENKSTFGADATITFPSGDVSVKSVTSGGFFTDFSYAQSSGKIELHGFFSSLYDSKSGAGTFATLTLSVNKDSGAGTVNFTCSGGGNDTQILDTNGQNILSCGSLNQLSLTYSSSGSPSGNTSGEPNSCNGTCGSHYNCKAGLFCNQGYCRNPDCPNTASCGCVTASPTTVAKGTPKATTKPTPQVVTLATYTPLPTNTPESSATPEGKEEAPKKLDLKKYGLWAGILATIFLILSAVASVLKNKNKPPKINPPVIPQEPTSYPPPMPPSTPINPPPSTF